jgi:hypothetical protein
VVLQTDETGRARTPAARREYLLDGYEHSGLSGAKFAALAGIKYSTFAAWVQRRWQSPQLAMGRKKLAPTLAGEILERKLKG